MWPILWAGLALAANPFAECDAALPTAGETREAYRCYYMVARRTGDYDAATARVKALVDERPASGWARLTYAGLRMDQLDPGCREDFVAALELLTAAGDVRGEVYAATNFSKFLHDRGESAERDALLSRAARVAKAAGDDELYALAQLQRVRMWVSEGFDLGACEDILREVEPVVTAGDYQGRLVFLNTWANLYYQTGRVDDAHHMVARLAETATAEGDVFVASVAREQLADAVASYPESTAWLHGGDPDAFLRDSLAIAREGGNPVAEAGILGYLARRAPDAEAEALWAQADAAVRSSEDGVYIVASNLERAEWLASRAPARSHALLDETLPLAKEFELGTELATIDWVRSEALWAEGKRDEADAAAAKAFDALEALRDTTASDAHRAGFGATSSDWYYRHASRWMAAGDLERAFAALERMRAVEVRRASGETPAAPLRAVQAALGSGEVMLVYAVPDALLSSEPARVLRITKDSAAAFELPAPADLERRIDLWLGLLPAGDGAEAEPGASILADLVGPALADLPAPTRLIVVADGALHRMPLSLAGDEVAIVPSAAVWLAGRAAPVPPLQGLLIVADPAATGTELPPLPRARAEADALVARWPGAARLEGEEAGEAAVIGAIGGRGLVHFAAHAVTDEVFPDRSGLILAGADRLTAAEIAGLPLDGRLVVLSACRSAGGRVAGGEGPLGVSRAFLRAGARTVVATLWPLRDEDAEALFSSFAGHLADGLPAGRALSQAQKERIAAGAPTEAWAGVVLLGDPDVTAPGVARTGWWPYAAAAAGGAAALALLAAIRRSGATNG
jgi:hypothetical protein